jgi:hypothetical protein
LEEAEVCHSTFANVEPLFAARARSASSGTSPLRIAGQRDECIGEGSDITARHDQAGDAMIHDLR